MENFFSAASGSGSGGGGSGGGDDRGRGNQRFNLQAMMKASDISSTTQRHLVRVYLTLAAALGAASLGAGFNIVTGIGGFLGIFGFLIFTMWLAFTPSTQQTMHRRQLLLGGVAVSQGLSIGPLISASLSISPNLIILALLATTLVFGSFSGAALLSRRRSYLYLGGMLSSLLSIFMMMRLATMFFPMGRAMMFEAELYVGLIAFLGYVLFDTQMIVERAENGDRDHVRHALDLFVDFGAILVRLLIIMMRNAQERERREASRRKQRD